MSVPQGPRIAVHEPTGRRVVPIEKAVFTIGRSSSSDLQLTSADVSRDHAVIITDAEGYLLRDRGSRTGTFVNGEVVSERRLIQGDEVECGRSGTVLMFLTAEPETRRPTGSQPADLRHVAALLDALRDMGSDRVLDEVLALVLDAAIEATGAERGFIMLADGSGALEMKVARAAGHVTLPPTGFATSRKIPEKVFETGEVTMVADLLESDMAAVHTGTVALGIRHVLCAPLRLVRYVERSAAPATRRNIGVLYLDSRERGRLLSDRAREEVEGLAGEAALAIENARLYQQAVEKARIDQELATASRIQRAMLPEPHRVGPFFEAVGASLPSRSIGGDFFDYHEREDGAFGFSIGDVTGKGPPAALLTALVQGLLAAQAFTTQPPDATIALINRVLLSRPIESRFVSVFLAVLTPDGRLTYSNAAQNPPLLVSGRTVRRLDTGGTLVGAFPDARWEREQVQLTPGDTIVLFSDGITEAVNDAGEEFREEGIRGVLERTSAGSPQQVLDALFSALAGFTRGAGQHDDMTAVVLRFRT